MMVLVVVGGSWEMLWEVGVYSCEVDGYVEDKEDIKKVTGWVFFKTFPLLSRLYMDKMTSSMLQTLGNKKSHCIVQ